MEATCSNCPFWSRKIQYDRDADGNVRPITARALPVGDCHHSSALAFGAEADFTPNPDWFCEHHPLRQRDQLAAMAMQGIVSGLYADPNAAFIPSAVATDAYEAADALLAERAKALEPKP